MTLCPTDESDVQPVDVWLLNGPAAVEQHVSAGGLHKVVLHLSDRRVIKMVPGPSHGTVAQRRVVTHVQVPCVILERGKKKKKKTVVDVQLKLQFSDFSSAE